MLKLKKAAEIFNEYIIATAENVKRKAKIILLMMIMILWIVIPVLWNKLLLTLTQVWNRNARQRKELNEL